MTPSTCETAVRTMKKSQRCPKCDARRIWVIERYRVPGESAEGRVLPVVPHQAGGATGGLLAFTRVKPVGRFDLYLCDGCGYSELWAEDFRDLVADEARGIRLLDTTAQKGPFR
jgi:predicted nucleic-acid-binding Zn-ribbon protein